MKAFKVKVLSFLTDFKSVILDTGFIFVFGLVASHFSSTGTKDSCGTSSSH